MSNLYRFWWGAYSDAYSDKGEEWFTHERKMTAAEVAGLLRETWPNVRDEVVAMLAEHKRKLDAWMSQGTSARLANDAEPYPHRERAGDVLLRAAGFVCVDRVDVEGDALFECWSGDEVATLDRELQKMGRP